MRAVLLGSRTAAAARASAACRIQPQPIGRDMAEYKLVQMVRAAG